MASSAPTAEAASQRVPTKDEIGHTFVMDYYTTLNQDPAKTHRYYKNISTFTHAVEGEIVPPCIGQRAIHDKIESLGFKDCTVLLSTVDSVESVNGGIVIQVLGELSNDNAPSQKFAQTFFLAMSQPPAGYYVLNNIFRFLKEDVESDFDDDVEPDSANEIDTAISHGTPLISDTLTNGFHPSSHSVASEEDASGPSSLPVLAVPTPLLPERGLESEDLRDLRSPAIEIPADTAPHSHPPSESSTMHPAVPLEPAPVEPSSMEAEASVSHQAPTVRSQPEEVVRSVEPSVEPSVSSAPTASTTVVKTWATMAAIKPERIQTEPKAGGGLTPLPKGNGIQALPRKEATKILSQKLEKQEPALGYIKHVLQKVTKPILNSALVKFGELNDLDINRQKSCGFVEFSTHAALHAAIAAGPIDLGDNVKITVEERRKSTKAADGKTGKQSMGDRRPSTRTEDSRGPFPKKMNRGAIGPGPAKPRTE